jgi:hypothetical protein
VVEPLVANEAVARSNRVYDFNIKKRCDMDYIVDVEDDGAGLFINIPEDLVEKFDLQDGDEFDAELIDDKLIIHIRK